MAGVVHVLKGVEDLGIQAEGSQPLKIADTALPTAPPDLLLTGIKGEAGLGDLELLHRRYYNVLCNYACRFVPSKAVSQDLVSDVFFKLWRDRESLEVKTSARAYLFTAVRNRAYNYLGREHKAHEPLDSPASYIRSSGNDPEESLIYGELEAKVESAIDQLTPQCRKVFMLSRYDGLKYKDIAVRLGITPKAVEANMGRALKSLGHTLGHYLYALAYISLFLF